MLFRTFASISSGFFIRRRQWVLNSWIHWDGPRTRWTIPRGGSRTWTWEIHIQSYLASTTRHIEFFREDMIFSPIFNNSRKFLFASKIYKMQEKLAKVTGKTTMQCLLFHEIILGLLATSSWIYSIYENIRKVWRHWR